MKPRCILALLASVLWLGPAGCATPPNPQTPATPANHPAADADYPGWTKAAGWLLLPFTGASQSFGF